MANLTGCFEEVARWREAEPAFRDGKASLKATLDKLREEVDEVGEASTVPEVLEELADVFIVWVVLTRELGLSAGTMANAVVKKMEINRGRKWERQPDGTVHHVG